MGFVGLLATASAAHPSGLRKYAVLARRVEELRVENDRLGAENARLAREVRAVRSEPAALERAIREELRYVRPGERVYWLGAGRGATP